MREQSWDLGIPEEVGEEMGAYAKELIVGWLDVAAKGGSPDTVASEAQLAAQGLLDLIERGQVLVSSQEVDSGFFISGYLGSSDTNMAIRYLNLDPSVVLFSHGLYPSGLETVFEQALETKRDAFIEEVPRIYEKFGYGAIMMGIKGCDVVGVDEWERLTDVGGE